MTANQTLSNNNNNKLCLINYTTNCGGVTVSVTAVVTNILAKLLIR